MQFKFLHFEEGSDETLTKAWAATQELMEESESKAPEPVTEGKRKAVKTMECAQVSFAKFKKPKFSDAIDATDTPRHPRSTRRNCAMQKQPAKTRCRRARDRGIIRAFCFNYSLVLKRPNAKSNHICRPSLRTCAGTSTGLIEAAENTEVWRLVAKSPLLEKLKNALG